ncbi:MAG: hypothetical protein JNL74_23740, partial [Fibrobacteres bacterium]|nr:hypothetical protein [Fibrobacterota bacterium]
DQPWSSVPAVSFKKGDIVELDEREEYMRWGEYKLVKIRGDIAVLIDHNSSQYMGTDWESSDYFEVPKKKIRAKPKDSGKSINVGDLVEYKWENSWFYGRVTGINRGQYSLDQYHSSQMDMWFERSKLRHPVKENFSKFSLGESVEYYWDYSWRKATVKEIKGLFTLIHDENADWDGWVHPYLLRKK